MYTLAFDTTGSSCSIILLNDKTIVSKFSQTTEFGQAEILMEQIAQILKETNITFKDINLTAVCAGPGSFTGVRSSIAATRAFGLACPHMSVCGISAFEAYIEDLNENDLAPVNAVIIETKRDDFYVQYFDQNKNKLSAPSAKHYEDIKNDLLGKKVTLTGDGVERFLNRPSGLSLHMVNMPLSVPIEALGKCAIKKFERKTIDFPKPLYIKAPDVCVK